MNVSCIEINEHGFFSNKFYTQGNDQVRFEMTYYALYPQVKVGCC